MMLLILFSPKPELESMFQEPFSLILKPPSLMKLELEPTDNSSIQNNLSVERKMQPTISPEVITLLVKKSSICALIESESLQTSAQVSKGSLSSMLLEVELGLDLDLFFLRDSLSITVRNLSSDSPSIHPHKSQLPSLSHITQFYPLILFLSIQMLLLFLITKLSMIFAEEILILKDLLTQT